MVLFKVSLDSHEELLGARMLHVVLEDQLGQAELPETVVHDIELQRDLNLGEDRFHVRRHYG